MFGAIGYNNNIYSMAGWQNACQVNPNTQYCSTESAAQSAYACGFKLGMTHRIQNLSQTIDGAISQLIQYFQNPNLTADEKNKIKEQIESLQKLKEQVQAGLTNLPTLDQMAQMEKAIGIATQNELVKAQEMIQKHAEGAESEAAAAAESAVGASEEAGSAEASEEAVKKAKEKQKKQKSKAVGIISEIYTATEGSSKWGWLVGNSADYPKLRQAARKMNKDNVADMIVYWHEQYEASSGKSLVKALFDVEKAWNPSLHGKDQNKKNDLSNANNMDILWNMTICLKEKAEELGIYSDLAGQFTIAFDELDDTDVDQEAVENALNAIAAEISTKQIEKLAESAQEEVDTKTKTEAKQEASKKKEEVIAQKKQDFQNALRKAYDLGDKLPELVAGFKVITDDNGEFKEYEVTIPGGYTPFKGSSFDEIKEKLKDLGIDPEKALIKKVNTKA